MGQGTLSGIRMPHGWSYLVKPSINEEKNELWSEIATSDFGRAREWDGGEISCAKNAQFCTKTLAIHSC